MNPGKDLLIIVLLIVSLTIVFFAINSIPQNIGNISKGGFMNFQQQNSANTPNESSIYASENNERELEKKINDVEQQIEDAKNEIAILEKELEYIETYGERSPHQGSISIKKLRWGPQQKNPQNEYIELNTKKSLDKPIVISGWSLKSNMTNRTVVIDEAVALFFSGTINAKTPVALGPNDKAFIITGRSPIGESFQINKCSGYFTQFQKFYPPIGKLCPAPKEEILSYTRDTSIFNDDTCLDYINRINRCRTHVEPLPIKLSYACQDAIITEINYNACITKHKNDPNFYTGNWRIYLKRSNELWKAKREVVVLLDENEKVVDYFTY